MITGYEIREIVRPDGRTIWRLVEIYEYYDFGKSDGVLGVDKAPLWFLANTQSLEVIRHVEDKS